MYFAMKIPGAGHVQFQPLLLKVYIDQSLTPDLHFKIRSNFHLFSKPFIVIIVDLRAPNLLFKTFSPQTKHFLGVSFDTTCASFFNPTNQTPLLTLVMPAW